MLFDKFVIKSENGVLVLYLKDGFWQLCIAIIANSPQIWQSFCREWAIIFFNFWPQKITALAVINMFYVFSSYSRMCHVSITAPFGITRAAFYRLDAISSSHPTHCQKY